MINSLCCCTSTDAMDIHLYRGLYNCFSFILFPNNVFPALMFQELFLCCSALW